MRAGRKREDAHSMEVIVVVIAGVVMLNRRVGENPISVRLATRRDERRKDETHSVAILDDDGPVVSSLQRSILDDDVVLRSEAKEKRQS